MRSTFLQALLPLIGALAGALAGSLLGLFVFKKQKTYEARLQVLRDTASGLVELSRLTSAPMPDPAALSLCLLRLDVNLVLCDVLFDHRLYELFKEVIAEAMPSRQVAPWNASVIRLTTGMAEHL